MFLHCSVVFCGPFKELIVSCVILKEVSVCPILSSISCWVGEKQGRLGLRGSTSSLLGYLVGVYKRIAKIIKGWEWRRFEKELGFVRFFWLRLL